jgi:ribosomal protein S18 acetylase RimI-like enzyme
MTTSCAARGFIDCCVRLGAFLDGASLREVDDAVVGTTGIRIPTMNGVLASSVRLSPSWLELMLDDVARTGLPYCLQLPVTAPAELVQIAVARGMVRADDIPLMEIADLGPFSAARSGTGLAFRVLAPEEYQEHAPVAAEGFGIPVDLFEAMITARFVEDPATTVLIGELDGTAVTTGVSITIDDRTGIFNIATPEPHRGRGYGTAVTGALIADGIARGANCAFLQSSQVGLRTYERLGFRIIDLWQCWVSQGAPESEGTPAQGAQEVASHREKSLRPERHG